MKQKILVEGLYGHGAKRAPIHKRVIRAIRRLFRKKLVGQGMPFDWTVGFDIENKVGQIMIKNQQQSDSCGGMAGSYFLEIQRRLQNIQEGPISAKSIYAPISYPGGGTTINDLETQIGARGANLEAAVPDMAPDGTCTEAFMSDKSWQTLALMEDAATRAGYTPVDVPIDLDSIAQAIMDWGAVILEIQGQNNGTWLSPTPAPPVGDQNLWAHFICSKAALDQRIYFYNSWGTTVGLQGVQSFGQDYIDSGNILACFTLIHDDQLTPMPGNDSIWAGLVIYFQNVWKTLASP